MSVPRLFDHTVLDCCMRCEQEAVFRFRDNLAPERPTVDQLFGQAVHAGIADYWSAARAGGMLPISDEASRQAAVAKAWGAGPTYRAGKKEYKTLEYACDVVEAFVKEFPVGRYATSLASERYLESAVECGIVDGLERATSDGLLYVADVKTTGLALTPAWQGQWRHSQQAARYLDLSDNDAVERVAGFVVYGIHLDRRGYPKPDDFVRVAFSYDPALRAELAFQRGLASGRALKVLSGAEPPVKNTSSCFRYNELCSFFKYCWADPKDRADMLKLALATGELTERAWEPGKERR